MPLDEKGNIMNPEISNEISNLIDESFLKTLLNELYLIFNISLEDRLNDQNNLCDSDTAGWNIAYRMACIKTNKPELIWYFQNEKWYESSFDNMIYSKLKESGLVLIDTTEDYLRNNLKLEEEIVQCDYCGKFFKESQLSKTKFDTLECNQCDIKYNKKDQSISANNYYKNCLKIVDDFLENNKKPKEFKMIND